MNAPIPLVLELPMAIASNVTVIAEEPAKPVPVTVNEEPTMPLVGLNVMNGFTVNEAVAVWEAASVAVTACGPFVDEGMVNVAENEPRLLLVIVAGIVDCAVPSYLMVMMEEAAKPVPVTVTLVPAFPLVGPRVMAATILKVAVAVCEDASDAVTVWAPLVDVPGIVNVALNAPTFEVVIVVGVVG